MPYRIEKFNKEGDPIGHPKVVGDTSAEVAQAVRKCLGMHGITEVELHYHDGTSKAFTTAPEPED